jgi:hypothetical protein
MVITSKALEYSQNISTVCWRLKMKCIYSFYQNKQPQITAESKLKYCEFCETASSHRNICKFQFQSNWSGLLGVFVVDVPYIHNRQPKKSTPNNEMEILLYSSWMLYYRLGQSNCGQRIDGIVSYIQQSDFKSTSRHCDHLLTDSISQLHKINLLV